mmetsp:Transcript_8417/g.24059  ORF Transcript_8417/g.24059 Transcript_8417/m.24059 type:complete len:383 (+) Transcript_8417:976-2124(+)
MCPRSSRKVRGGLTRKSSKAAHPQRCSSPAQRRRRRREPPSCRPTRCCCPSRSRCETSSRSPRHPTCRCAGWNAANPRSRRTSPEMPRLAALAAPGASKTRGPLLAPPPPRALPVLTLQPAAAAADVPALCPGRPAALASGILLLSAHGAGASRRSVGAELRAPLACPLATEEQQAALWKPSRFRRRCLAKSGRYDGALPRGRRPSGSPQGPPARATAAPRGRRRSKLCEARRHPRPRPTRRAAASRRRRRCSRGAGSRIGATPSRAPTATAPSAQTRRPASPGPCQSSRGLAAKNFRCALGPAGACACPASPRARCGGCRAAETMRSRPTCGCESWAGGTGRPSATARRCRRRARPGSHVLGWNCDPEAAPSSALPETGRV